MTIQIGRHARMYLDDLDVYLRSFEMEQSIESVTADVTKYGDDWEIAEVVQGKGNIIINSYLDDVFAQGPPDVIVQNSLDLLLWKMLIDTTDPDDPFIFQTPATLTFIPFDTPVIGSIGALFMQGFGQFAIAPAVKGLVPIRSQFVGAGPLNRGVIIDIGTQTISSAAAYDSSPGVEFVLGPTKFVRASLHVFAMTSTATPTLTFTLESDDNAGFTSEITRVTFDPVTRSAGQYKEVALVNGDEFYRLHVVSDDPVNTTFSYIVVAHLI